MPDKDYMAVLLEVIRDQNKAVLEAIADIKRTVTNQPTRLEFEELRQEVAVMRAVVNDLSHDHERRITRLEAA